MKKERVSKAFTKTLSNRSVYFDDINDYIELNMYDRNEVDEIIKKILTFLPYEEDVVVHESMMNILSSVYLDSSLSGEIDMYILNYIDDFNNNSLFHGLSIVSESNLENRFDILRYFSQKNDQAVSDIAKELLSVIENK